MASGGGRHLIKSKGYTNNFSRKKVAPYLSVIILVRNNWNDETAKCYWIQGWVFESGWIELLEVILWSSVLITWGDDTCSFLNDVVLKFHPNFTSKTPKLYLRLNNEKFSKAWVYDITSFRPIFWKPYFKSFLKLFSNFSILLRL